MRKVIDQKLQNTCEMLGISEDEALILLSNYQWRDDLLQAAWFEDLDKASQKAGIMPIEILDEEFGSERTCPMCFDTLPQSEFDSLKCKHTICKGCWDAYIDDKVSDSVASFIFLASQQRHELLLEVPICWM